VKCCTDRKTGQRLGEFRTILASEFEYVEKLRISVGGRLFFHVLFSPVIHFQKHKMIKQDCCTGFQFQILMPTQDKSSSAVFQHSNCSIF